MGNALFIRVVGALEFLGDIFSAGIVKKGVTKQGATPDTVTAEQMEHALDDHIIPALRSFVNPTRTRTVRKQILAIIQEEG